jgi:hypothetical protein
VIVYEMLAGAQPFVGSGSEVALANVTLDPPAIALRVPGSQVDPLLEAFGRKLMARIVDRRFQSAHEALAMLELIENDRIAAARELSAPYVAAPARMPAGTVPPPMLPPNSEALPTQTVSTTELRRRLPPPRPRTLQAVLVGALLVAVFLLGYLIV